MQEISVIIPNYKCIKPEWKEKCDPAENEELFLWNLY